MRARTSAGAHGGRGVSPARVSVAAPARPLHTIGCRDALRHRVTSGGADADHRRLLRRRSRAERRRRPRRGAWGPELRSGVATSRALGCGRVAAREALVSPAVVFHFREQLHQYLAEVQSLDAWAMAAFVGQTRNPAVRRALAAVECGHPILLLAAFDWPPTVGWKVANWGREAACAMRRSSGSRCRGGATSVHSHEGGATGALARVRLGGLPSLVRFLDTQGVSGGRPNRTDAAAPHPRRATTTALFAGRRGGLRGRRSESGPHIRNEQARRSPLGAQRHGRRS